MDPWSIPEFRLGFAAGAAALVALASLRALTHRYRTRRSTTPSLGLVQVATAMIVLAVISPFPWQVPAGVLGVMGASAGVHRWTPARTGVAAAATLPFAVVLATAPGLPDEAWFRSLVVGAVVVGAVAVHTVEQRWATSGVTTPLVAITAGGIYAAVPDTEQAAALLAVALPLAVLGWPLRSARLGSSGAAGYVALLMWSAAFGARGRPAAMVGAVACLGLIVGLTIGPQLARGWLRTGRDDHRPGGLAPVWSVVIVHATVVLVAARTSGLQSDVASAVWLAVVPTFAAIAAGAALAPARTWEPDVRATPDL